MRFDKKKYPFCTKGHEYAEQVVAGQIVACKYVIGACKRYLADLDREDVTWHFDVAKAEKYLRNVQRLEHVIGTWKTPKIIFEPWQCWVWMCVQGFRHKVSGFRRFRVMHLEIARGNAKMHYTKSKVPTPDGMKLWEEIGIGSRLYDRLGGICRVTGKTKIKYPQAYEIKFSDGTKDICGEDHLWFTSTKRERSNKKRHEGKILRKTYRNNTTYERVRTTKEIARTLTCGIKTKERNHSVKNTLPVIGEKKHLLISPYVLGYWLGNGSSETALLHCDKKDALELKNIILKCGYSSGLIKMKSNTKGVRFKVDDLHVQLKTEGLLKNKHIPEKYFLSTVEDRLELVRGLMDSDGSINSSPGGQAEFTNKNKKLADGLNRLLCSLGYRTGQGKFKVSKNNNFKSNSNFYRIYLYPRGETKIFNLERKYSKQISSLGVHGYTGQRYIVAAKKLKNKYPMFCVSVDSPDQSYLITESYIPTHNSTMLSQLALNELALDDPNGNQISTVATKKDQARIVLDASRAMARKNASYRKHTGVKVLAHSLVHVKSNSIMRSLASEANGLDGLNDILAICDELHSMNRDVFEVISSGMSKRTDSLLACITTAGQDVHSVGHSQSSYAKKVCMGDVVDDQFFAVIYTLDEADDWEDETVWIKANPNLGVSVDITTLRAKIEKALVTPADIPNIKIKHFNLWISEALAYFDQAEWDKCADPTLNIENFRGLQCRNGLDLASSVDITSNVSIFRKDGIYYLFDKSYLPEETLKKAKNALYDDCVAKGFLISTPGAAINYGKIETDILEQSRTYRMTECMYDAWSATELAQRLSNKIEMVKVQMNVANLSEPMKKMDALMREGKLRHNGSPLLRWCLGNVVAKEDHNGNVFPRKSHTKLKIDPIVAALMALAGWLQDKKSESVYESRGLRTLS